MNHDVVKLSYSMFQIPYKYDLPMYNNFLNDAEKLELNLLFSLSVFHSCKKIYTKILGLKKLLHVFFAHFEKKNINQPFSSKFPCLKCLFVELIFHE